MAGSDGWQQLIDQIGQLSNRVSQLESDLAELVAAVSAHQNTLDGHQAQLEQVARRALTGDGEGDVS